MRLAYSQNVHPAASARELVEALHGVTARLRERLGHTGAFGVGLYFSASVAEELEASPKALSELAHALRDHAFDPFTYNAFPFARFGESGLKAAVFDPPWSSSLRVQHTQRVARLACGLAEACEDVVGRATHVSISTHTGAHSSRVDAAVAAAIPTGFQAALVELARLERERRTRVVLALEPEPRANVNDLAALAAWRTEALAPHGPIDRELAARHLGACIDACHAAVEFEEPLRAFVHAIVGDAPLGKLQYTNALALHDPARHEIGRERFFALDEPRYLHQVTALGRRGLVRAGDLGEVRERFQAGDPAWCEAREWRCHFHVPTDLEAGGTDGLGTTRAHAEALLGTVLGSPGRWGTDELHLEIETYTWSILSAERRGAGELVDGLEREYRHVLGLLAAHGWRPG